MWNISHPELVDKEEYETYDGIDDLKDKIEYYLRNPS
ncbi:glycosyltransferase [Methanobrevibacter thaueri]|nr:glycosyltransferase [Methanobrevibacter thaueri]